MVKDTSPSSGEAFSRFQVKLFAATMLVKAGYCFQSTGVALIMFCKRIMLCWLTWTKPLRGLSMS